MDKIAVLIVTYNRKELLLKVLNSAMSELNYEGIIFIVDNNSTDGTEELLTERQLISEEFENFEDIAVLSENRINGLKIFYLRLKENLGGSGGFHYGVKLALENEKKWDWLWFLDDDAMPEKGCLSELLRYKDISSVLIPLRYSEKINYKEFPAIKFNLKNPFLIDIRDIEFYKKFETIDELPEVIEVEDFSFEGPLIKKNIVKKIGLPKKDIFISGDDTDYALRIRYYLGEKLNLIPKARIKRLNPSAKNEKTPYWKEYYLNRNYYYTHFRYGENMFVKFKPFFLFPGLLLKNFLKLNFDFKKFRINFFALIDSLRKEMPKRYLP